MPNNDGTGPMGTGPRSGGGFGKKCRGAGGNRSNSGFTGRGKGLGNNAGSRCRRGGSNRISRSNQKDVGDSGGEANNNQA